MTEATPYCQCPKIAGTDPIAAEAARLSERSGALECAEATRAMTDLAALLERDLAEAERKAWDALARWKFWMFGYHAADVIKVKRRLGRGREPFFKVLVETARKVMRERYGVEIGGGT